MKTQMINLFKMKTLIMMLVMVSAFMLMGARAHALDWQTANQSTVAWDAVTQNSNGDPIPATDVLTYVGYLSNSVTDPEKANPVQVYSGPATQATLTLNAEGSFYFGVKVVRALADGTNVSESTVAWSDTPVATGAGNEFGLRFYLPPAAAGGLRPASP